MFALFIIAGEGLVTYARSSDGSSDDWDRGAFLDNELVTDQLSLSIWLNRSLQSTRLKQFEKMLLSFPFSQRPEQPQSSISIQAIGINEPPLLERLVNGPLEPATVIEMLKDYQGEDVSYQVEGWWDLWQYDGTDWKLKPTAVELACFGPEFDNGTALELRRQENLRIEFGVDTNFLPQPEFPGSAKLVESNVKSLLRLVHEIDASLPVERRKLETESGENFAHRLQAVLTGGD